MSTSTSSAIPASAVVPPAPAPEPDRTFAPPPPVKLTGVRAVLARITSTTPGSLRFLLVLTVLASILFGVFAQQAALLQSRAADEARHQSEQLIGLQDLRNHLVNADATAANAFLVGGLESPEQRTRYVDDIRGASEAIATLSAAEPADSDGFAEVARQLTSYTGLIEQARANNRQGFPVGAAYLDQASSLLATGILAPLDTLVENGADRVAAAYDSVQLALLLFIGSVLALAVLVIGQVWLARRTHRYLNRPLAVGTAMLLLLGIGIGVLSGSTATGAAAVRHDSYRATLDVSQALTAATDAKSLESFALIKRGSGGTLYGRFDAAIADSRAALQRGIDAGTVDPGLRTSLDAWVQRHGEIRTQDQDGNWDQAVSLAVATGEGSSNAAFDAFSTAAGDAVDAAAERTRDTLSTSAFSTGAASWVLLVAGLIAAGFAWRGVQQRLEEYR